MRLQAVTWNLFAPIQATVSAVYNWSDSNIAWLANTANIGMLVSLPFSAVLAEWGGARIPTIVCAVLLVFCTALRIAPQLCKHAGHPMSEHATLALNVVSMAFNGLAAAWLNFAGTEVVVNCLPFPHMMGRAPLYQCPLSGVALCTVPFMLTCAHNSDDAHPCQAPSLQSFGRYI